MTSEICTDNRFVLIAKYFDLLKQKTNIETSHEEMQVVEDILFRCWQLRWLDTLEKAGNGTLVEVVRCKDCGWWNEDDSAGWGDLGNNICACAYFSNEDGYTVYTEPNDYCSKGQREEDEG